MLLRYAFGITNTRLEDSLWYLFSATLVLGLSYTMTHDGHVRVDFVYQRYTVKNETHCGFRWHRPLPYTHICLSYVARMGLRG